MNLSMLPGLLGNSILYQKKEKSQESYFQVRAAKYEQQKDIEQ
jgi:hypothetical protein